MPKHKAQPEAEPQEPQAACPPEKEPEPQPEPTPEEPVVAGEQKPLVDENGKVLVKQELADVKGKKVYKNYYPDGTTAYAPIQ